MVFPYALVAPSAHSPPNKVHPFVVLVFIARLPDVPPPSDLRGIISPFFFVPTLNPPLQHLTSTIFEIVDSNIFCS